MRTFHQLMTRPITVAARARRALRRPGRESARRWLAYLPQFARGIADEIRCARCVGVAR